MKIFDTLSKDKKEFIPITPGHVGFYQCGPTLYWNQHIGNLRSVVIADTINRTFNYLDYKVDFIRNYTDVGHLSGDNEGDADSGVDRMEKASERENKAPEDISLHYQNLYEQDVEKLNTLPPQNTPKATEHIKEMIDMVKELLENGYAYQTELAIYFDISKKEDYTKLSKQNITQLLSGHGHGSIADSDKKNPGDFSLWFFKTGAHKHALQTWKNPFSETDGFPGWHIECSAMSKKYLGPHFDIHMGGIEHIPIHHTNEIAQSECANQSEFVNYWVHNEHLLVDGKKMSKSEGTSFLLSDVIDKGYSPLDLRYFFLQAHYRSKQNFTWDALEASKQARKKMVSKLAQIYSIGAVNDEYKTQFIDALGDDFGLPEALSLVYTVLSSNISSEEKLGTILDFDNVLGLDIKNQLQASENTIEIPSEIQELLDQRSEARLNKDWQQSDEIRDKISELGYEVQDAAEGQQLYKK